MSAHKWVLAVVAVFGLAAVASAQGPGGGRQCGGGGGMQGGGNQSMMRGGGGGQGMMRGGSGGQGMMTGNSGQYQQLQAMQQRVLLQQLQGQQTANNLAYATAVGRANHARQMAANNAKLQAGK